jgi:hypothetical protein
MSLGGSEKGNPFRAGLRNSLQKVRKREPNRNDGGKLEDGSI